MKICFTGAHGVGKTTLVTQMASILKEITGKEHVKVTDGYRNLQKLYPQVNLSAGVDLPQAWMLAHRMRTSFLQTNFVADRSVVDTFAYITEENKFPPGLNYLVATLTYATISKLTALIYVPIMFDLIEDEVRPMSVGYQQEIDANIQLILKSLREDTCWQTKKRIYSITSLSPKEREEELHTLVQNLKKAKR